MIPRATLESKRLKARRNIVSASDKRAIFRGRPPLGMQAFLSAIRAAKYPTRPTENTEPTPTSTSGNLPNQRAAIHPAGRAWILGAVGATTSTGTLASSGIRMTEAVIDPRLRQTAIVTSVIARTVRIKSFAPAPSRPCIFGPGNTSMFPPKNSREIELAIGHLEDGEVSSPFFQEALKSETD